MSELINENPRVLADTQLPSRKDSISDVLFEFRQSKSILARKTQMMKIGPITSPIIKAVDLLETLLLPKYSSLSTSHTSELINEIQTLYTDDDNDLEEIIDAQEIYDLIAHISDPEHPLTLGQLAVVNLSDIEVHDTGDKTKICEVIVKLTPTITHCSLATLIGLGVRIRLERSLSPRFRITVLLKEGTHQSEDQVNKQLNDKERVAAACENHQLLRVLSKMLTTCK